jgi:transposase-like protein
MSSERAVPFYCPYCGEEDLRQVEEPLSAWRCAGCLRTFAVKLVGIGAPSLSKTEVVAE